MVDSHLPSENLRTTAVFVTFVTTGRTGQEIRARILREVKGGTMYPIEPIGLPRAHATSCRRESGEEGHISERKKEPMASTIEIFQ